MIKIMICDDFSDICEYFSEMINSQEDMTVVCTASDTSSAISQALEHKPDIILMDIQMDEHNSGIIAAKQIMEKLPKTKIIMLTIHNNDEMIVDAYLAGAVDYIIKETDAQSVYKSIRNAYEKEDFLGTFISSIVKKEMKNMQKQKASILYIVNYLSKLTKAESLILNMLYNKHSRKDIAAELCLSENTVKIHIRHILRKLGFSTTAEMITFLDEIGIMKFLSDLDELPNTLDYL